MTNLLKVKKTWKFLIQGECILWRFQVQGKNGPEPLPAFYVLWDLLYNNLSNSSGVSYICIINFLWRLQYVGKCENRPELYKKFMIPEKFHSHFLSKIFYEAIDLKFITLSFTIQQKYYYFLTFLEYNHLYYSKIWKNSKEIESI